MKKRLFILIVGILVVLGVSNAQTLTLSTEGDGTFGNGCLVPVDVYVDTKGESISAMDLLIESSLEYKDFESSNIFPYYFSPVVNDQGIIHIVGFTVDPSERFVGVGKIGTLYFIDNNSDVDASIMISFLGEGELLDTNLSIAGGIDVLKSVGNLFIKFSNDLPACDNLVVENVLSSIDGFSDKTFDEVLENTISKINQKYPESTRNNIIVWLKHNMIYLLGLIILLIVLFIIYKILLNKKGGTKGNI